MKAAPGPVHAAPRVPRAGWLVLALLAAVLLAYHEVGGFGFVRYDDPEYVRDNPAVNRGFSWSGFAWACGAHASNWHPLTWLSHMLDVELFGLAPGGHHWTSVALHALGAGLCFLALRALTARTLPAFVVAALFALHPLRVESVAWVSERKDVLSGCAFFAFLLAYARWVRAPGAGRYALVLAALALGLAAKPMLVSAPFVLLLLDVWPLARLGAGSAPAPAGARVGAGRAVLEKLPLFLMVAAASRATGGSPRARGARRALEALPLAERLANAPLALVRYLAHFLAPSGLAYFYPHPGYAAERGSPWDAAALGALALVLALCALAFAARRRLPAVFVGWFWFLGMLVPVLGLVQVGEQALADRYAYLPAVGLQLALVFPLAELATRRPRLRLPLAAAAGIALLACALASVRQARTWKDSESLFRRALAVTDGNYPAWLGLANELADQQRADEARAAYRESLSIHPRYGPALYGLGLLEQRRGDPARALELYREAIAAQPTLAAAHLNLGVLLGSRGDVVESAQAFERVLELFPAHPDASFNLAQLLFVNGRLAEAEEHLATVVQAVPAHTPAWERLGELQLRLGRPAEARAALERAVVDPGRADAARLLAELLLSAARPGDAARALELARRAVAATRRADPRALGVLAAALAANGDFPRAAEVQEEAAARLEPGRQDDARARAEAYRRGERP